MKLYPSLSILLIFFSTVLVGQNNYQKAWQLLESTNYQEAEKLLLEASQDPKTQVDANASLILLSSINGKFDLAHKYFLNAFNNSNAPFSYLYALWFNDAALGEYGKKNKNQLALMQKILNDPNANGSIQTAIHYMHSHHYTRHNDFKNSKKEVAKLGGLKNWQYVGPFNNSMGSGFHKDQEPIYYAKNDKEFKSKDNAPIKWFSPPSPEPESWIHTGYYITESVATNYAQTFVEATEDLEAILAVGATGSLKVWVNDKLIISEAEERRTELDTYKAKCKLKKGFNRILVQLNFYEFSMPNFMVRIIDENYKDVPNLKTSNSYQPYIKDESTDKVESIPLFAEEYFKNRIAQEPNNFINHILLCKTYLRNHKIFEAKHIINEALAQAPNNILLRIALIECYVKDASNTELLTEAEWIKTTFPNSFFALAMLRSQLIMEENYSEALQVLNKQIKLYGETENTMDGQINLARYQNQQEQVLQLISEAYKKYPNEFTFVVYQYRIEKELNKDRKKAIKVLEKFSKDNFQHKASLQLVTDYMEIGQHEKALELLITLSENFPHDVPSLSEIMLFYYLGQEPDKALKYALQTLELAPYSYGLWTDLGQVYEQKGEHDKAIDAFKTSLVFNPNQYDIRQKLYEMENKEPIVKLLPQEDEYQQIAEEVTSAEDKMHDWYYIFKKRNYIIYPKGASEEHSSLAIKINNEHGIDYWKDVNIPYNEYTQRLVIESAEIIKSSGAKVHAERNESVLVFTNLEINDVIYVKYRLENYQSGKFAQYFWDKHSLNSFVPIKYNRYCLLVPKGFQFDQKILNTEVAPQKQEFKNFTQFIWEGKDLEAIESEPLMPYFSDIGINLHLSNVSNWGEIASWYNDLSLPQAKMSYELEALYQNLFDQGKDYSDEQKARIIYDYIVKNIQYSSISFRQSGYVPQKANKTYTTKLGDCKDVATLFVTLARKAGLKANLVLINTRDNGKKDVILPSLNFNHCIVKVELAGQARFLELTNTHNPFGSLPPSLWGSAILEIVNENYTDVKLNYLTPNTKTPDKIHRSKVVQVSETDLKIDVKSTRIGYSTASHRQTYSGLDYKKQLKGMKEAVGYGFKNPIELHKVTFDDLEQLSDSLNYSYQYTVKNEIINIGEMNTFKIPFSDLVITPDKFGDTSRQYPIDYWQFEVENEYTDELTIVLPEGKQFIEVPKNIETQYKQLKYQLTFQQIAPNKIKIVKRFVADRKLFEASEFKELKKFFEQVIKTENSYLAFK